MKTKYDSCLKKKTYSTTTAALKAIEKSYRHNRTKLRFYECNQCLDFHLTHVRTESMKPYFDRWDMPGMTEKQKTKNRKYIQKRYEEFCRLFNKMNKAYNKEMNSGKKTTLKGVLPRAERLRILAEMKARKEAIDQAQHPVYKFKTAVYKWYTMVKGEIPTDTPA
jgi:hypothetical protein